MNQIYNTLAKKYGLDIRIIKEICASPFKFTHKVMADKYDTKGLIFAYLFKIKLRNKFKDDKTISARVKQ